MKTVDKTLYVNTSVPSGEEPHGTPLSARIVVDDALIADLLRMSEIVKTHGLFRVERFDYRPEWLRDAVEHITPRRIVRSPCSLDCISLSIGKDCFWYEALIRHSDIVVKTEDVSFDMIPGFKEFLAARADDPEADPGGPAPPFGRTG